jgi:6-phosphogluconolactonase
MATMTNASTPFTVYIGTYTPPQGNADGILSYRFDPATGGLTPLATTPLVNPSFLAIEPRRGCLYAVSEVDAWHGQSGGGVSAFAIGADGALTLLNQQPTQGDHPCYVSIDRSGQLALVANYSGGSVAAYTLEPDGRLSAPTAFVQHAGSSVNPQRQEGPHAHSIQPDPDNQFAVALDLGIDQILLYRIDPARGTLSPGEPPFVATTPGAGPRHLAFHPNGRVAYVINELDSTIASYRYNGGRLDAIATVPLLPPDFKGENTTADIHVHPSGRFVYGSNRGDDSIGVFGADANGGLRLIEHVSTQGRTPRNFALDPSGAWLLVANQNSDNLVTLRIDQQTGRLEHVATTDVPTPVCVLFAG